MHSYMSITTSPPSSLFKSIRRVDGSSSLGTSDNASRLGFGLGITLRCIARIRDDIQIGSIPTNCMLQMESQQGMILEILQAQ